MIAPQLHCLAALLALSSGSQPQDLPASSDPPSSVADPEQGTSTSTAAHQAVSSLRLRLASEATLAGVQAVAAEEWTVALRLLREANELVDTDPVTHHYLARTHAALGNARRAAVFFRSTVLLDPANRPAALGLAEVLRRTPAGRREAAAVLVAARERFGNSFDIVMLQAYVAASLGEVDAAEVFFAGAAELAGDAGRGEVMTKWGQWALDLDELDRARRVAERLRAVDEARSLALSRDIRVAERAHRLGFGPVFQPHRLQGQLQRLAVLRHRQEGEALALHLGELLQRFSTVGEVHRVAAELARSGQVSPELGIDVELSLLRATALNPGDEETARALGKFYCEESRFAEGVVALRRGQTLAPRRADISRLLFQALRGAGQLRAAYQHALAHRRRFGAGRLVDSDELRRLLESSQEAPVGEDGPTDWSVEPTAAAVARATPGYGRALALLAADDAGAALASIRYDNSQLESPHLWLLEARVLLASGRSAESVLPLRRVLALEGTSNSVVGQANYQLGRAAEEGGDMRQAARAFSVAAAVGHQQAPYRLLALSASVVAALPWGPTAVLQAGKVHSLGQDLRGLSPATTSGVMPTSGENGAILAAASVAYTRGLWLVGLWLAAGVLTLAAAVGVAWVWLYGGEGLAALASIAPEAVGDTEAVLLAIRHEVLKHHTLALDGLVHALEQDEPSAADLAHLQDRLQTFYRSAFGVVGVPGLARQGAWGRLRRYVRELNAIGRRAGVRLNLWQHEAGFSALAKGFHLLKGWRARLSKLSRLRPAARRQAAKGLRQAAELLHTSGMRTLDTTLLELRTCVVSAALLNDLFSALVAEGGGDSRPGAAQPLPHGAPAAGVRFVPSDPQPLLSLQIARDCSGGVAVRLPRAALRDIVTNLLRNALQASAAHGLELSVGMRLERDVRPITGFEVLRLAVCDRVPGLLSREQLLSRRGGGGLGVVLDHLDRYGAHLDVEAPQGDGWGKAVVVCLPTAEGGPPPTGARFAAL